jgi:hypothetical protein
MGGSGSSGAGRLTVEVSGTGEVFGATMSLIGEGVAAEEAGDNTSLGFGAVSGWSGEVTSFIGVNRFGVSVFRGLTIS